MRRLFLRGYVLAGAGYLATYLFVPHSGGWYDVWWQLFSVVAVVGVVVGLVRGRPAAPWAWILIAAGLLAFMGGDTTILVYDWLGRSIPYPGVADWLYLCGYPLIAAGLLLMIRRSSPGRDWSSLIDAGIVATGAVVVSWVFLIEPYARDATETLMQKAVSVAEPTMDMLLLALLARMLLTAGRRPPSYWWLVGALVLQLTGDVGYGTGQLYGFYHNGSPLDLPLAGAYLAFGMASLHPSMGRLTEPTSDPEQRLTRRRLALLTVSSFVAPGMLCIGSVRAHDSEWSVAVGGGVLLFGLAIARLAGVVGRHERAVMREQVLREAASRLVAAADRGTIHQVALEAVQRLADDGRFAVEVLIGFDEHEVVAAEKAERPAELASAAEFPLIFQGTRHGSILVRRERPLTASGREATETLAAQVALALESAMLAESLFERQSAERFRSLVQSSADLIAVVEPDLTIRSTTPSVRVVLGYGEEELVGCNLSEVLDPDELEDARDLFAQLGTQQRGTRRRGFRLRRKDGTGCEAETVSTNLIHDPNVRGYVFTAHDVSAQKGLERELSHQAFHDSLTGLANRALFLNRLEHALDRRPRKNEKVAVVFIDLDNFKAINDSRGHTAGDQVLVDVAERLQRCMRPSDTCGRFGGDEFAVLLDDSTGRENAEQIASRILDSLIESPVQIEGAQLQLTATAGVAIHQPGQVAGELLRDADIALHAGKQLGKNRCELFVPAMRARVLERTELQEQLRNALDRHELELHYQPIIELASGTIAAFEALARWHPDSGPIPPDRFIPLAEESGLIHPLGKFVLQQACHTAQRWRQTIPGAETLRINVNISGSQLLGENLRDEVREALTDSGLTADSLTLEITESVLMENRDETVERLNELRALGVRIALDDFGTGYSSLEYLWAFPIDQLKIARSFVGDLGLSTRRARLSTAIIRLGATRDVETVAEGIEEAAQVERLRALKCTYGQGFYISRPLPPAEAEAFLKASADRSLSSRAIA